MTKHNRGSAFTRGFRDAKFLLARGPLQFRSLRDHAMAGGGSRRGCRRLLGRLDGRRSEAIGLFLFPKITIFGNVTDRDMGGGMRAVGEVVELRQASRAGRSERLTPPRTQAEEP